MTVQNDLVCACGGPVFIKKTQECRTCYHRRYHREHYTPKPPPPRRGATPETATPCTYDAAHSRVRNVRGLPSGLRCAVCGETAEEWAYKNASPHEQQGWMKRRDHPGRKWSTWSPYVYDYDPLCSACHRARDAEILPRTAGRPENTQDRKKPERTARIETNPLRW